MNEDLDLERAIWYGDIDPIKTHIKEFKDKLNRLLCYAAYRDKRDIVEFLLNNGADDCNRALVKAAKEGRFEMVNLLISKGADDFDGGLCGAASGGFEEIVELMLEKGADCYEAARMAACHTEDSEELEQAEIGNEIVEIINDFEIKNREK